MNNHILLGTKMKLLRFSKIISLALFATACQTSLAQTITKLTLEKDRVIPNENVTILIDYESTKTPWCGLNIAWGNGVEQDLRVGDDDNKSKPLRIKNSYSSFGTYMIVVTGRSLRRGLFSASECEVLVKPIKVTVFDAMAEERDRREARERQEAAEKQRAAKLQEETRRKELETLQQDLVLRELELKRKELELREAAVKRGEESRRAPSPLPAATPTPPKSPPAPKPVAPIQKPDGF